MIATSQVTTFRALGKMPDAFNALASEATELFKALLQPGKFVEEVVQMRALQVKEQSRQN